MLDLLSVIIGAAIVSEAQGCSAMGGSNDNEWLEDPVFDMSISPPIGWTYFPAKSTDSWPIWYFVGQSNDTLQAKQKANTEIRAAVENPTTNLRGTGPLYGKVEAGALAQTSIGGTADFIFKPYTIALKVTLRNSANTRYKWNIVKNTFMQKLSLNFYARFNGEIVVNKF